VAATTRKTGVATRTLASQRQRGDGGDPVGVTSRSRPIEVIAVKPMAEKYSATHRAPGSAPGRTSSPQVRYCAAAAVAVSDRATVSSSQPTGWRGRRLASTAPTVAPLTMATTGNAVPGVSWTRSARPAWRSSRSSSGTAARVRMVSSHSAHADTTGQAGRLSPLALTSGP
jgi:hypothetical protein